VQLIGIDAGPVAGGRDLGHDVGDQLPAGAAPVAGQDRGLRDQTATEMKTDLLRLRRDLESGRRKAAELSDSKATVEKASERSIAVLYFENLSGVKEDEYFRDGVTEDIITELSKIQGMHVFSRPTVLAWRDKPVLSAQQIEDVVAYLRSLRD